MNQLKEIFYNPKTGFVDVNKLYEKAKEAKLNLTRKEVKELS